MSDITRIGATVGKKPRWARNLLVAAAVALTVAGTAAGAFSPWPNQLDAPAGYYRDRNPFGLAAISLVGTTTASAASVAPTAHQAGDFILYVAGRGASTTAPTNPAGAISLTTESQSTATTAVVRVACRTANGTSDGNFTFTNANEMICAVYRPPSGFTIRAGQVAVNKSTTSTVNFPALSPMADGATGNSWVVGIAFASNTTQALATAPAGMTNETSVVGASYQAALHDTAGGVSSWSSANANVTGAGSSVSVTVELVLEPVTDGLSSNRYQHVGGGGNPFSRGNSGNAYKITLPRISGAGNTYVLSITYDGGAALPTASGAVNGSLGSAVITALAGAGNLDSAIYVLSNIASGQETVTVTFSSATRVFQYVITEFYGVTTAAFTPSAGVNIKSTALSTTIGTGSMTPPNNNGTGGNLVYSYFAKSDQVPTNITTGVFAGANATLLNADIGWNNGNDSMTKAAQAFVQAASAAVNSAVVSVGETGDNWNSLSISLPISAASGVAPSGISIAKIDHFATVHFPATGSYALQCPATGNLRVLACTDPNLNTQIVTDSEGNTWTNSTSGFFYLLNSTANPNLVVYLNGGGGDITLSWRFFDCYSASSWSFDSMTHSGQTLNGLSSFTCSPAPSPTSASGLMIANVELGQGPGLAVTAPAGAVWDLCTYTGETDLDLMENADICAHYKYTSSGAQTWTFTITNQASNSSDGGIGAFASTGGSNTTITPTGGSDNFTGVAPTVTPAANDVITPLRAWKRAA